MEERLNHTLSDAPVKQTEQRDLAVAIQADQNNPDDHGRIVASGQGQVARDILDIAFANDIKVREDAPLATILSALDLDTPIPSEAIVAVAEILAKVYEANGSLTRPSESKGLT